MALGHGEPEPHCRLSRSPADLLQPRPGRLPAGSGPVRAVPEGTRHHPRAPGNGEDHHCGGDHPSSCETGLKGECGCRVPTDTRHSGLPRSQAPEGPQSGFQDSCRNVPTHLLTHREAAPLLVSDSPGGVGLNSGLWVWTGKAWGTLCQATV